MRTQARRVFLHEVLYRQPGSFLLSNSFNGMFFSCPCGCSEVGYIAFKSRTTRPTWTWDGNEDRPTITPDVQRTSGCMWQGTLTQGMWMSAKG